MIVYETLKGKPFGVSGEGLGGVEEVLRSEGNRDWFDQRFLLFGKKGHALVYESDAGHIVGVPFKTATSCENYRNSNQLTPTELRRSVTYSFWAEGHGSIPG